MSVAVTGGAGFRGLRVVRELLREGERVLLLGHAGSRSAADRLRAFLRATGDEPGLADAVATVAVDVSRPRLGLDERAFRELAADVSELWHCAGSVDLQGAPARLRAVNVEGTRHVLDLAAA